MPTLLQETLRDASLYAGLAVLLAALSFVAPRERRRVAIAMALLALASLAGLWLLGHFGGRFDDRTLFEVAREALLALLAIAVIRAVLHFVMRVLLARLHVPALLAEVLLGLALVAYALVRLTAVGVNLAGVVTTSAVITGAIAFSAQEVLGALWAGLALQLDRTLRLGDWINVDGKPGEIVAIRWRTTTVRTRMNETIVIPNAHLIKDKVRVIARGTLQRAKRDVTFQVAYETPPSQVIAVVEDVLAHADIPNVSREAEPDVYCVSFDDSGISYAAYYTIDDFARYKETQSEVLAHIYAGLQRAGMTIPFPQRDVRVFEQAGPEEARRRQLDERTRALQVVGLFGALTPPEVERLAAAVRPCLYVKGDLLFRQGEPADSLYVLRRGRLAVYDEGGGARRLLATIDAPGYVGEMGLLTGQPRAATVVAEGDVECLRVDQAGFDAILRARPEIVEALSELLAKRQAENDATLQVLGASELAAKHKHRAREIVHRIRRFFRLPSATTPTGSV